MNMNKKIIWGIIVVVIVAIVGVYLINKSSQVASPIVQDTTDTKEVSEWKTYKSNKYGFEFKYPKEFVVYSDASTTSSYEIVFTNPKWPETEIPLPRVKVNINQKDPTSSIKIGTKFGDNNTMGGEMVLIDKKNISQNLEIVEFVWSFPDSPDSRGSEYQVINRHKDGTDYFYIEGFEKEVASTFKFTSTPTTSTSDWKTYNFTGSPYIESGPISFKYPSDWKLDFAYYTTPGGSKDITSISITSPSGIEQIIFSNGGRQSTLNCDILQKSNANESRGRIVCKMIKGTPFYLTYTTNVNAEEIYNQIINSIK